MAEINEKTSNTTKQEAPETKGQNGTAHGPHPSGHRVRASYGVNRVIEGDYDPSLAVRCHNGTFVGKRDGDIDVFRGIPFAKPPVGELRWKRPEPIDADDRVFEAYFNGKSPIQTEWPTEQASYYPQGEDCLYLNIWCDKDRGSSGKTVMVFIHGGSYGWGGTADPIYDGAALVKAHPEIVLVSIGYRIGMMGFIDLSYLKGGEDFPDAPNLGLLDQIEALRWVQKNIAAFGGDSDNVTLFGESAGGGSVSLLPMIQEAKGLFRRVIGQSGSVALTFSKEECHDFTRRLIKKTKATCMDDLMALSEAQLMAANEELNTYNNFPQRDGRLIPLDPYQAYFDGTTADVDMLMGTNSNELNYWIGEIGGIVPFRLGMPVKFENDLRILTKTDKNRVKQFMELKNSASIWRIVEFYNEIMFRLPVVRQAEGQSRNGGRMYVYYWTEPSSIRYMGACHAVELAYVFGNRRETIYTGSPADKKLTRRVQDMWVNFARTGDPSTEDMSWPQYSGAKRDTMVISKDDMRVECDVLEEQRRLLYPILRYRLSTSYTSLDYNVPFVRKAAVIGTLTAATVLTAAGFVIKKLLK